MEDTDRILNVYPAHFVNWTVRQLRAGLGLVPFVGSGLSASSGILTGQNFTNFLTWTIYRSVLKKDGEKYHDLRHDGWPDPPNQLEVDQAKDWVWRQFLLICEQCGVKVNGRSRAANEASSDRTVYKLGPIYARDPLNWRLLRPPVPDILWSRAASDLDDERRKLFGGLGQTQALRQTAPRHGQFATSPAYIQEAAVRALQGWRGALDFLARLKVQNNGLDAPLSLDEQPDQEVIDAFNLAIIQGCRPNLAHNMLCHLASRTRMHTILTTNFDSLIEDAFAALGERLESIPVSLRGELPGPATVRAQNCIIKLHGSLLETRADFSLDDPPSLRDLDRFFEYVRGRAPGQQPEPGHLPSLLLVCGYSGSDLRCVQMIQHLLDTDSKAKVLWVCHSASGLREVERAFPTLVAPATTPTPDAIQATKDLNQDETRVVVTVTNRCDLLLYDLYQRLTLSLTRGGYNYQFSPNVPPGLGDESDNLDLAQKNLFHELLKLLENKVPKDPPLGSGKEGEIVTADGDTGLLPVARAVYRHYTGEKNRQGIWLWLGDHANTASLAQELFTVMAVRLGRFQLDHAQFGLDDDAPPSGRTEQWQEHISELFAHWNVDPAAWFVVVDGRNGTGGGAGWTGTPWEVPETVELTEFLVALQRARNKRMRTKTDPGGIKALYTPCSSTRKKHLDDRWPGTAGVSALSGQMQAQPTLISLPTFKADLESTYTTAVRSLSPPPGAPPSNSVQPPNGRMDVADLPATGRGIPSKRTSYIDRLAAVWKHWLEVETRYSNPDADDAKKARRARRALYAATAFRHSRHFSAFLSEGVMPCPHRYNIAELDNDWDRYQQVQKWLEQWKKDEIFHEITGGFAWMYRDLRLGIRHLIEEGIQPVMLDREGTWLHSARESRARIHFWGGDWYARVFRATGHAEPLLEALHHYGQCVLTSVYARMGVSDSTHQTYGPADIKTYRQRYARRAMFEIIKLLRLSRKEVHLWVQNPAGEIWFAPRPDQPVNPVGPDHPYERHIITRFERVLSPLFQGSPNPTAWEPWVREFEAELYHLPQPSGSQYDALNRVYLPDDEADIDTLPASLFKRPRVLHPAQGWWDHLQQHFTNVVLCRGWTAIQGYDDALKEIVDCLVAFQKGVPTPNTSAAAAATLKSDAAAAAALNSGLKRAVAKSRSAPHFVPVASPPRRLHLFVQMLLEMAYATVLCAKRLDHCQPLATSSVVLPREIRALWTCVCALSWLALDLCQELPPALGVADARLRIGASTLYGLALGRLGRFFEAHRRLNEAHGWLSKTDARLDPLEVAIIEIRRAEVHVLEAARLKRLLAKLADVSPERRTRVSPEKPLEACQQDPLNEETIKQWEDIYLGHRRDPALVKLPKRSIEEAEKVRAQLWKCHIAKLDDTWLALETAERALSGKTHSTLWWSQLHTLRLRAYAEHAHDFPQGCPGRALMFRQRRDHIKFIQKLYRAGHIAGRIDAYYILRLVRYTVEAFKTIRLHPCKDLGEEDSKQMVLEAARELNFIGPKNQVSHPDNVLKTDFNKFKEPWSHLSTPASPTGKLIRAFYDRVKKMLDTMVT